MAIYSLNKASPDVHQASGLSILNVAKHLQNYGQEAWIAPSADVIGAVKLEKGSSVWFNATIRGDNELITVGENSNVQDGSVLHSDMGFPLTIGKNVTIGHMVGQDALRLLSCLFSS